MKWIGEHIFNFIARFRNDVAIGWHGDADRIKILPRDFLGNEDATIGPVVFDDTGTLGIAVSSANTELYAFVPIPFGKKATHVRINSDSTLNISVAESNINASGLTSKGTGQTNSDIDITDVSHSATNYLTIKVVATATTQIVYGGTVTIADIV
tara:strand:+ start:5007 stop:5468 length:462 start_codon:yes stop_codon:yes gene_type:complete